MINSNLNGKASSSHNHDSRYYTESEMNTKLNAKANIIKFNAYSATLNKTYVKDGNTWIRQWGAVAHCHFYLVLTSSVSETYHNYNILTNLPPALHSGQSCALAIDNEKADCLCEVGDDGILSLHTRFTNMASKIISGSITYIAKTALYN